MEIGFKPNRNVKYRCFRSRVDRIIEDKIFPNGNVYLIPTVHSASNTVIHEIIYINSNVFEEIDDKIKEHEIYFRYPNGIVLSNWALISLSADVSHCASKPSITMLDTFRGFPISMSPYVDGVVVTVVIDSTSIVSKHYE